MSEIVRVTNKRIIKSLSPVSNYNRSEIEELGASVRLVDQDKDNNLDLYCYVKCTDEDSNELKNCRGVVYHEDKVIMRGFPYTTEYNDTEKEKIENIFDICTFYNSYEGSLIRVFNYNSKWYLSTHRKLDSFYSKWSSKSSFGESFQSALESEYNNNTNFRDFLGIEAINILERFKNMLDTNKHYMFLVLNNLDNRIVCNPPNRPTVYHVGTFYEGVNIQENIGLLQPEQLHFLNPEELIEYVKNINWKNTPGVIGFTKNLQVGDIKQFKILNTSYQDSYKLRGNEPSIKFRYLQIRNDITLINKLTQLYPEKKRVFIETENTIKLIAVKLHKAYIDRYIKKLYIVLPQADFTVIKECHSLYTSKTIPYVKLSIVINVLNKQSSSKLNHMIKSFVM